MRKGTIHIIFVCLLLLSGTYAAAQQGAVSGGGDSSSAGGSISFSIGLVDHVTAMGNTGIFAQGLQHSYEFLTLSGKDSIVIIVSDPITVYPNPVRDRTTIRVISGDVFNMNYVIHDFFGKKIAQQKIQGKETPVSLAGFANAMYFISVIDTKTGRTIQTIKIIKVP